MRVFILAVCKCGAAGHSGCSGGPSAVNIILDIQSQKLKQIIHFICGKTAIVWLIIAVLDGSALLAQYHGVSLNTKEQ